MIYLNECKLFIYNQLLNSFQKSKACILKAFVSCCYREQFRHICSEKIKVPNLIVMKDIAIAKSQFINGNRAIDEIQDFNIMIIYLTTAYVLR